MAAKSVAKKKVVAMKKAAPKTAAKKRGNAVHGQLSKLRRSIKSRPIRASKPKRKPVRRMVRKAA